MLKEYLTNKENTVFFTYEFFNDSKNNMLNKFITAFITAVIFKNKEDLNFKKLILLIENYYNLNMETISNYNIHYAKYENLFDLKVGQQFSNFSKSCNILINDKKNNSKIPYYYIKDLKYIKINNIKDLTENSTRVIKANFTQKNIDKKINIFKEELKFLNDNQDYFLSVLEKEQINFSCTEAKSQDQFNDPNNHFLKQINNKKLKVLFLEEIEKVKFVINKLLSENEKIVSLDVKNNYVKDYTGNFLDTNSYKKSHELFYLTASNKKGEEGFVGLKRVSHQQYSICYRPVLVQNIENASLFNEKTILDSTYELKILDKVYVLGDFKKVEAVEKELSPLGLKCQVMIDKSKIEQFLSQDKENNLNTGEEVIIRPKKINKI